MTVKTDTVFVLDYIKLDIQKLANSSVRLFLPNNYIIVFANDPVFWLLLNLFCFFFLFPKHWTLKRPTPKIGLLVSRCDLEVV